MKLSNKILVGGFIGIILLFVGLITVITSKASSKTGESYKSSGVEIFSDHSLLDEDAAPFNGMDLKGAWDISVVYSEDQRVIFNGGESYLNRIISGVRNGVLYLKSPDSINPEDLGFKITVYTPELSRVVSKGAANIKIEGVNSQNFHLNAHGIINLITDNCIYRNVELYLEGIGNLELNSSEIKDLYIDSSILGSIVVDVNNAIIDGNIEGMGSVTIEGGVKSNRLQSDGIVELIVN